MGDGFENTGLMRRAWFKPMVGAWFALLLGGGLWLMPPHVHGVIAGATQLTALHPMFALPVSAGGVAAMALVVAMFGFFLGIAVADRVAAASAPRAFAPGFETHSESVWEDERQETTLEEPRRRRVFSAREDIGEEGIAIGTPTGDEEHREADYEDEYFMEDTPPATPEEDFQAVYAEMDEDYVASDYEPEEVVSIEEPLAEEVFDEEDQPYGEPAFAEEAEYEVVEESEQGHGALPEWGPEPAPEHEPETEIRSEREPVYASHRYEEEEFAQTADSPLEESEAMGDMSLNDLLGRLEGALEQHKKIVAGSEEAAQQPAPQPVPLAREAESASEDGSDDDPVIAFLRREADRRMPPPPSFETDEEPEEYEPVPRPQTEAQTALRSALERLGQVNRRD